MENGTLHVEIDAAELAVRMYEASCGLKRPCRNAVEAMNAMDAECADGWMRAAMAALDYIVKECFEMGTMEQ